MKIFIDSIDIAEIKSLQGKGLIHGITTNPNLMKKSAISKIDLAKGVCSFCKMPFSIQIKSGNYDEMLQEALMIHSIADNIVIKIPITEDGLRVAMNLSDRGIPVNMTLCFSLSQALLVARTGATYVSPFIARIDDVGGSGAALIEDIRNMYDRYGFSTKIIAASIRNKQHVEDAMIAGADIATMNSSLIMSLIDHPLTKSGLAEFDLSDHIEE